MTVLDEVALPRLLAAPALRGLSELAGQHAGAVVLVGGAVRDALLGEAPRDLDLVVVTGFEEFLDAVSGRLGRRPTPIGDRFQDTHRFRWAGVQVDLARSQGSLEEDLARRDFTVNAMGLVLPAIAGSDVGVDLRDPQGGLDDLRRGVLRQTSAGVIEADPLRTLRAIRYVAALPRFALEAATRKEIRRVAPALAGVASERKVAEWGEILQLTRWVEGLELARELGVAAAALGPLAGLPAVSAWAAGEGEGAVDARPRFGALLADLAVSRSVDRVAAELLEARWPRSLVTYGRRMAGWYSAPEVPLEDLARRALEDSSAAGDAAELCRRIGRDSPAVRRQAEYAARVSEDRWIRGADLLQLGADAGPALGKLLESLAVGQVMRRWPDAGSALDWARGQLVDRGEP